MRPLVVMVLALSTLGCVSFHDFDTPSTSDAADVDAGIVDSQSSADTGVDTEIDGGLDAADAGVEDAPNRDAAPTDAEPSDADSREVGTQDTGAPVDASTPDAGMSCRDNGRRIQSTTGGGGERACDRPTAGALCQDFRNGLDGWCNRQALFRQEFIEPFLPENGRIGGTHLAGAYIEVPSIQGGFELRARVHLAAGTSTGAPASYAGIFLLDGTLGGFTFDGNGNVRLDGYYIRVKDDGGPAIEVQRYGRNGMDEHADGTVFETSQTIDQVPQVTQANGFWSVDLRVVREPAGAVVWRAWSDTSTLAGSGDDSSPFGGTMTVLSVKAFQDTATGPVAAFDYIMVAPQ